MSESTVLEFVLQEKKTPKFNNSSLQNQDWSLCKSIELIMVYQWYLNCQFGSWPECVISFPDCPSPIQSLLPSPATNQKRNCKWYTWLESFPLPKTRIHKCLMNLWLTTGKKKKKTVPKFSTKLACLLLGLVLVLSKNHRMNSALAIKIKKNLSNNSMMLKNTYLFLSFHEIKTSNSASQNPLVPTKTLHWKKLKNTRITKGGVREKGRRGKHTHHLCHESECRRLFGTLEQHSTTHRLLSINNPDRLLPGTSPEKNSKTKTECAPVFFHITLFGAVLHQRQASALAHAREEHVEFCGRHRKAKLLH